MAPSGATLGEPAGSLMVRVFYALAYATFARTLRKNMRAGHHSRAIHSKEAGCDAKKPHEGGHPGCVSVFEAVHERVPQLRPDRHGTEIERGLAAFRYLDRNRRVLDLAFEVQPLGIHALDLLTDAGNLALDLQDVGHAAGAIPQHVGQPLLCVSTVLQARLDVPHLLGDIFSRLAFVDDVSQCAQGADGFVEA